MFPCPIYNIDGLTLLHLGPKVERDGAVLAVAFSPDSRYLLSGGTSNQVQIWDLKRKSAIKTLEVRETNTTTPPSTAAATLLSP